MNVCATPVTQVVTPTTLRAPFLATAFLAGATFKLLIVLIISSSLADLNFLTNSGSANLVDNAVNNSKCSFLPEAGTAIAITKSVGFPSSAFQSIAFALETLATTILASLMASLET